MNLETLEAITKAAPKGPYHIGHINENLGSACLENPEGLFVAEIHYRTAEPFFCTAIKAMPLLIEVAKAFSVYHTVRHAPGSCSLCTAFTALEEAK